MKHKESFYLNSVFRLIIIFLMVLIFSCRDNKRKNELQILILEKNDSIKLFSAIDRDSAYFINYKFSKQNTSIGATIYTYYSEDKEGLRLYLIPQVRILN